MSQAVVISTPMNTFARNYLLAIAGRQSTIDQKNVRRCCKSNADSAGTTGKDEHIGIACLKHLHSSHALFLWYITCQQLAAPGAGLQRLQYCLR
jgi:hypothetical protein